MNNFLENLNPGYVMASFIIVLMTIVIIFSPTYNYVICQYEQCYRAESYTKTSTGLEFKYDNKKRVLEGPYTLREK